MTRASRRDRRRRRSVAIPVRANETVSVTVIDGIICRVDGVYATRPKPLIDMPPGTSAEYSRAGGYVTIRVRSETPGATG